MKLSNTEHRVLMGRSPALCKTVKSQADFGPSESKTIKGEIKSLMDGVLNKARDQERDLTPDEQEEFDALHAVLNMVTDATLDSERHRPRVGNQLTSSDRKPGGWYDSEGREVRILAPSEKVFNGYTNPDYRGLTAGSLIRGAFDKRGMDKRVQNALSVGTGSAGGFTVPEDLMANLIDNLRNQSRVIQAGARTVILNTDQTTVARLSADPTAAWRAENGSVSESAPTFEQVTFTAKSLAVQVKVSNELLQDSVNIEQALENSLTQALALELDRVCLVGSGASNQPQGIYGATNVLTIDQGANGSAITDYTELLDAMQDLDENNIADNRSVIMAPREFRKYNGFVDGNNNPLIQPRVIADLPFMRTNQAPIDQTKGTSTDASSIFVGDFSQLMIGLRQELEITVNPFLYQGNLQTGFFATMRADIQLAHPEAFCVIDGVVPA